ncbi:MAG: hypothetical protein V1929_02500 [bacterium]
MGIYDRDYMKRPSSDDSSTPTTPFWNEDRAQQVITDFIQKHGRLLRNGLIGFGLFALIVILAVELKR